MKKTRSTGRYLAAVLVAIVCGTAFVVWLETEPQSSPGESEVATDADSVNRGKYLADAGNCISCHTTKEGEPFAGGVPFETPFGTIYSTNITPDAKTGIGFWTTGDFRRAMHEGISADGSRLFPAFPYPSYTKVTTADVDAIFSYLRTVAPVSYSPPENSFLLRQRWALRAWNALSFESARFVPDDARSEEWNRGAYLVQGLGHCGACHSPRNRVMAEITDRALEGGVILHEVADGKVRPWAAVDITSSKQGLGEWSAEELEQYLHKGFSRRAGTFGPMNDVIVNSLMKLTQEDIKAMAAYLKSLPGTDYAGPGIPEALSAAGASIYEERCEECHSSSGRGGIFSAPPLAGSAIVQADNPASLINIILYGPEMPDEVSFGLWETMKAYGDALSNDEVAAVSNYIRGSWENVGGPVSAEDVAKQR